MSSCSFDEMDPRLPFAHQVRGEVDQIQYHDWECDIHILNIHLRKGWNLSYLSTLIWHHPRVNLMCGQVYWYGISRSWLMYDISGCLVTTLTYLACGCDGSLGKLTLYVPNIFWGKELNIPLFSLIPWHALDEIHSQGRWEYSFFT